jgi:hypothetical protein
VQRQASRGLIVVLILFGGSPLLPTAGGSEPGRPPADKTGNAPMRILAVETLYLPYFERLICETDVLVRMRPLMDLELLMAKSVMTPETQRRREAELTKLWRDIVADLPAERRPPFRAFEFATHVRQEQIRLEWLAREVVSHATRQCPERLKLLGASAEEQPEALRQILNVMFRRLVRQGAEEGPMPSDAARAQTLLARFDRLPDLTARAREIGGVDIYAVRDRLAREHDEQKKPYLLSTPYRNPGSPCKSGEHHVAGKINLSLRYPHIFLPLMPLAQADRAAVRKLRVARATGVRRVVATTPTRATPPSAEADVSRWRVAP